MKFKKLYNLYDKALLEDSNSVAAAKSEIGKITQKLSTARQLADNIKQKDMTKQYKEGITIKNHHAFIQSIISSYPGLSVKYSTEDEKSKGEYDYKTKTIHSEPISKQPGKGDGEKIIMFCRFFAHELAHHIQTADAKEVIKLYNKEDLASILKKSGASTKEEKLKIINEVFIPAMVDNEKKIIEKLAIYVCSAYFMTIENRRMIWNDELFNAYGSKADETQLKKNYTDLAD